MDRADAARRVATAEPWSGDRDGVRRVDRGGDRGGDRGVTGSPANLLQKLGMRDRLELTRYAIRAGLIDP